MRATCSKGGFLIVDDFPNGLEQFDLQMSRVFPSLRAELDLDTAHPIFHSFFEIDSLDIVPPAYNLGGRPMFLALFEDNDPTKRMLRDRQLPARPVRVLGVLEPGFTPVRTSTRRTRSGVNQFIYGMTH